MPVGADKVGLAMFDLGIWQVELTNSTQTCKFLCGCQVTFATRFDYFLSHAGDILKDTGFSFFERPLWKERSLLKICEMHGLQLFEKAYEGG